MSSLNEWQYAVEFCFNVKLETAIIITVLASRPMIYVVD